MRPEDYVQIVVDAGGSMPLADWNVAVRAAGGNPAYIQRLKSQGLIHTTREDGQASNVVAGAKPVPPV